MKNKILYKIKKYNMMYIITGHYFYFRFPSLSLFNLICWCNKLSLEANAAQTGEHVVSKSVVFIIEKQTQKKLWWEDLTSRQSPLFYHFSAASMAHTSYCFASLYQFELRERNKKWNFVLEFHKPNFQSSFCFVFVRPSVRPSVRSWSS